MPSTSESEAEAEDVLAVPVPEPEPLEMADISDKSMTQIVVIIVFCVDHVFATQAWRHLRAVRAANGWPLDVVEGPLVGEPLREVVEEGCHLDD